MTPPSSASRRQVLLFRGLIPLLALIAVHPALVHGPSCGHDFTFHLESWLDAAQQMRRGTLYPHWAFTAAWSAGEPRFVFYPPLSWMLGALQILLLPVAVVPTVFTWLALTGAGLAMFALARRMSSDGAALIATTVYLANPYLLFTAFERTAYGELLCAAWMPLLVLAALERRTRAVAVAAPIGLLWLTNAPAAVLGSYAFALLMLLSLLAEGRSEAASPRLRVPATRLVVAIGGTLLGLALAAFYLVPAIHEQRFVQINLATIPNMRVEDSFLFGHTSDAGHNTVLHTVSLIAVLVLIATMLALTIAWLRTRTSEPVDACRDTLFLPRVLIGLAALTTAGIGFLMTPPSLFLWNLLPKLSFVQFPWRLLSVQGVLLGCAVALAMRRTTLKPHSAALLSILLAALLTAPAYRTFAQICELDDAPAGRAALLISHHGMPPTDEYTPDRADNDVLRPNDPAYWLADDVEAFAPGTLENPAATQPTFDVSDFNEQQTLSASAPLHLSVQLAHPQDLILNLRDYPAWEITRTGPDSLRPEHPQHLQRDDGLVAISLPAGASTLDVHWARGRDETLGTCVSALAAVAFTGLCLRSRKIRN